MITVDELGDQERADFRRGNKGEPLIMVDGKRKQYRRASSMGKILDDESGLHIWKLRTTVAGCAIRPDLMAQASVLNPEKDGRKLGEIAESCLEAARGTQRQIQGTAIHAMLDHIDLDHDWTPAPQFAEMVDAYVRVRDEWGLVTVDVEAHCVSDLWKSAGTMDRRYRTTRVLIAPDGMVIPIGTVLVGDTKTGRKLEYAAGTYACQLAMYAGAKRYDVETDERSAFDPPTFDEWGLIFHVTPEDARCDVYWVDLKAGRQGLALSGDVYEWRRRTDLLTLGAAITPMAERAATEALAAHPSMPEFRPERPLEAPERPVDLPAVRLWLRERVEAVKAVGDEAVRLLVISWPQGVDGLKYDTQTERELDLIARALDHVEDEMSMGFARPDPRNAWNDPDHVRPHVIKAWMSAINPHATKHEWWTLGKALSEFASVLDETFADADVEEMLDAVVRGLGYDGGITELDKLRGDDAGPIVEHAHALMNGHAIIEYRPDALPVCILVTNITQGVTQ